MTRTARLLPLSLGLLVACDAADPASLEPEPEAAAIVAYEGVEVTIVIQPYAARPTLNLAMGGVITVAVPDVEGFIYGIDPETVTFEGASPVHDLAEATVAGHHLQVVTIYAEDGTVVDEYLAFLFHFAPSETWLEPSPEPVTACLTGVGVNGAFYGCDEVLVRSRGGQR